MLVMLWIVMLLVGIDVVVLNGVVIDSIVRFFCGVLMRVVLIVLFCIWLMKFIVVVFLYWDVVVDIVMVFCVIMELM